MFPRVGPPTAHKAHSKFSPFPRSLSSILLCALFYPHLDSPFVFFYHWPTRCQRLVQSASTSSINKVNRQANLKQSVSSGVKLRPTSGQDPLSSSRKDHSRLRHYTGPPSVPEYSGREGKYYKLDTWNYVTRYCQYLRCWVPLSYWRHVTKGKRAGKWRVLVRYF